MRQIVLDTETTGISHAQGHRIIEIGCLELEDRRLTGKHFHTYLNPQRAIDAGALQVHGISNDFLADKPLFKDISADFLQFIADSELIIHNAPFDIGFLNTELKLLNHNLELHRQNAICDTLLLAKSKHPGQRNSLDALCKRYKVDNTRRTFHGALLDAEILAFVYLAMTGGQTSLFNDDLNPAPSLINIPPITNNARQNINSTPIIMATESELKEHESFMNFIAQSSEL